jgi:hypothetical protein
MIQWPLKLIYLSYKYNVIAIHGRLLPRLFSWSKVLDNLILSASQQTLRTLWKPEVHYSIHNSRTPVSVLSHINLDHAFPTDSPNIRNMITTHNPKFSKYSLSFTFHHPNSVCISPLIQNFHMPVHHNILDFITNNM